MKTEIRWYSIVLIGLVLLIAVSVIGCGQYTKEDTQEAYQTGYNAGFTEGYNAGLAQCEQTEEREEVMPPPDEEDEGNKDLPSAAMQWDEAKDHIGDRTTVCGPVAGTKYGATSSGNPTWLNIGKDYPSSERFVVIIWGENRSNFPQPPETYYYGKTICVTGLIQEYKGIPQIEVKTPDQIEEQ